jgi:hypothetical protein
MNIANDILSSDIKPQSIGPPTEVTPKTVTSGWRASDLYVFGPTLPMGAAQYDLGFPLVKASRGRDSSCQMMLRQVVIESSARPCIAPRSPL